MILLAYFCYPRGSEVVRMQRGDVQIETMTENGVQRRVLHVYVNPLCKNDKERKGHKRLVQERAAGQRCVLRTMEAYLAATTGDATAPLFPKEGGGKMSADTPRGQLRHWLQQS